MIKATIDGQTYENVTKLTATDGATTKIATLEEIIESAGLTPIFSYDFESSGKNFGNTGTGNVTGTGATITANNGTFTQDGRLYVTMFTLKNPTMLDSYSNNGDLSPIKYVTFGCGTPGNRYEECAYPIMYLNCGNIKYTGQNYRPYISVVTKGTSPSTLTISYRLSGATDLRYSMPGGTWNLKVYDVTDLF